MKSIDHYLQWIAEHLGFEWFGAHNYDDEDKVTSSNVKGEQ
jgi:hypothetical protein